MGVIVACAAASLQVWAQPSMLRISCTPDGAQAEVWVNGKFRGECPLDVGVTEGTIALRVLKKVDALRESVFEQQIRLGPGVVKKIEVELGPPRWNVEGQRREAERLAGERLAAEQRARDRARQEADEKAQALEAFERLMAAATAGDAAAMLEVGDRHMEGRVVSRDPSQAMNWYRKARDAGNLVADFKLGPSAVGDDALPTQVRDQIERILRLPATLERTVNLREEAAIREFVEKDPYFEVQGGVFPLTYESRIDDRRRQVRTCRSKGRLLEYTGQNIFKNLGIGSETDDLNGTSALGGLLWIRAQRSRLFFRAEGRIVSVDALEGQPFPLIVGNRFGMTFQYHNGAETMRLRRVCSAISGTQKLVLNGVTNTDVIPVACVVRYEHEGNFRYALETHRWYSASSCFVPDGAVAGAAR